MKPTTLAAALALAATTLSGCDKKCEGDAPRFTSEEEQWFPEAQNTRLALFRSSLGDTIHYRVSRKIDYPQAYTSKGGSTTCPDEQTTNAELKYRKPLGSSAYATFFSVSAQRRTNEFAKTLHFEPATAPNYHLSAEPEHLSSVTLSGVVFEEVERFDLDAYNLANNISASNRLKNLYFKKGIGLIGYEQYNSGNSTDTWHLEQ